MTGIFSTNVLIDWYFLFKLPFLNSRRKMVYDTIRAKTSLKVFKLHHKATVTKARESIGS